MEYIGVILKSLFSIVVLFFVTKIVGKKQVSELSLFDYIIGISIGNFAAEIILDNLNEYFQGLIAMATFGVSAFLVSYLSMKNINLRRYIFGVPTVIIQDGKIISFEREIYKCNDSFVIDIMEVNKKYSNQLICSDFFKK